MPESNEQTSNEKALAFESAVREIISSNPYVQAATDTRNDGDNVRVYLDQSNSDLNPDIHLTDLQIQEKARELGGRQIQSGTHSAKTGPVLFRHFAF